MTVNKIAHEMMAKHGQYRWTMFLSSNDVSDDYLPRNLVCDDLECGVLLLSRMMAERLSEKSEDILFLIKMLPPCLLLFVFFIKFVDSQTFQLTTTWADDNRFGNAGNMFVLKNIGNHPITITRFAVNTMSEGSPTVNVYSKPGSYIGYEYIASAWTLLHSESDIVPMGSGNPTWLSPLTTTITMQPRSNHSFFIHLSTGINYQNGAQEGLLYASDQHIEFYEGCAIGGLFIGHRFWPRIFSGAIEYVVYTASPTSPSLHPTHTPTHYPTTNPSISPTVPTLNPTSIPTVSPTTQPTVDPTGIPTVVPTHYPTTDPTAAPTMNPYDSPTQPEGVVEEIITTQNGDSRVNVKRSQTKQNAISIENLFSDYWYILVAAFVVCLLCICLVTIFFIRRKKKSLQNEIDKEKHRRIKSMSNDPDILQMMERTVCAQYGEEDDAKMQHMEAGQVYHGVFTTYDLPDSPSSDDVEHMLTPTGNDEEENIVPGNNETTKGDYFDEEEVLDDEVTKQKCNQCHLTHQKTNGLEDSNGVFYCEDCWNPDDDLYHHENDAMTTGDTIK